MQLEFLVEERSIEEVLKNLIPKIVNIPFNIRVFQGKPDLLKKLPERFKGYKTAMYEKYKIIVVVDRDDEDCDTPHALKRDGFFVRSRSLSVVTNDLRTSRCRRNHKSLPRESDLVWF
ncbi:MAG: hypothetical protein HY819_08340, partial [Acidobacteria bacterium]|nr:hypothetical protein [Acidobacteriota bacterium]